MTRHEAIATINSKLADADDETVQAVADIVESMTAPAQVRPLSERELALLEQAKEDFRLGRTDTLEDFKARTDAMLARYRVAKTTS